ncbi:MAG TPA: hypothetical protein ENN22_14075 [bacterium]|nr:hypothetical protein [bacterium]
MLQRLFYIILFLFIASSVTLAQQPDSTKLKPGANFQNTDSLKTLQKLDTEMKNELPKPLKGFIDKDGDGIDDRLQMSGGKAKRGKGKDVFIDKNGDGISDGRESAIGLKKIQRMRRKGRK